MSRNSSGTYTLPGGNPVVTGTTITSAWANTTLADLATAMTDSLSRSGDGGMLAPLEVVDGAVGVPGVSFGSEPTTGFWRPGAGIVALSILATEVLRWTAAGAAMGFAPGAVATPSIYFTGDANTGFWSPGADIVAVSTGGAERWRAASTGAHTFAAPSSSADTLTVNTFSGASRYGFIMNSGGATNDYAIAQYHGSACDGFLGVGNSAVANTALRDRMTIGTQTAHAFAILTSNAERVVVSSAGAMTVNGPVSATALTLAMASTGQIGLAVTAAAGQPAAVQLAGNGTSLGSTSFDIFQGSASAAELVQRANAAMNLYTNNTVRLGLAADGRVFGRALHNNGTVTGTTDQYIASGTYTPTLTNVANASSLTARVCQWSRVGNVVTVSGSFNMGTTLNADTQIGLSLPIASNFTLAEQAGGNSTAFGVSSGVTGVVYADTTNDRAHLRWTSALSGSSSDFGFHFTYLVA